MTVTDFSSVNWFRDKDVYDDPYPYYDWVRSQHTVWQEPHYGVYFVTGYQEAIAVYNGPDRFSSCNAVAGPFVKFSVPPEGDDITDHIARYRDELPFSDQLPTFDPPMHTDHRSLMMRLITPKRLNENEEFMWRLADRQLDAILGAGGRCEFLHDYAEPFTLLVIADLEGVPEADHGLFRDRLSTLPGAAGGEHKPLEFLYDKFSEYIEDRRRNPRADVMSGLATATFPDGSTPEVKDAALLAANLFAGGQETTVRLLSFAVKMLGDRPDLQAQVREDRSLIPNFIEETLRLESPLRGQFRMAKVPTELAGVEIPVGATLMIMPGAANRDPRTFEDPDAFDLHRANARRHIAFGHGPHTCAGAPLARAEGKVTLNRLFDQTADLTIDEEAHGPAGARRYDYLPTFFLRGLTNLHVELTPRGRMTFSPFDPEQAHDAWPLLAEFRRQAAVVDLGDGMAYVTRHAECRHLMRDTYGFSSAQGFKAPGVVVPLEDRTLGELDPPNHSVVRRVMVTALTPKVVKAAEPYVQSTTAALLAAMPDEGEADLVPTFSSPLPNASTVHLLGFPEEDGPQVMAWAKDLIESGFPGTHRNREGVEGFADGFPDFAGYIDDRIEERRQAPRDDVTTKLVDLEVDGERLTPRQLRAMVRNLITGGLTTTSQLLGNLLYELFTVPGLEERLRSDPGALPTAIEESLRLAPPVMFVPRGCLRDTEVDGTVLQAGQRVVMGTACANRDEAVFEHGDDFDVDRDNASDHLTFGYGPHFCPGAPMARAVARIAVTTFLHHFPPGTVRLTDGFTFENVPAFFETGPKALTVQINR